MNPETQPLFSVVIPAYKASATLGKALSSCLNQTRKPDEIIVVDDGGYLPGTWEQEWTDPSIQWVRRVTNGGPAQARNTGVERAKGKYIAFLDADDSWHPEKLFLLEDLLVQNPQIRFLFHDHVTGEQAFPPIPEKTTLYQYSWIKLLYRNPMATPSVIIDRALFIPFRPTMRYMEDYDLWLRMSEKTPLYYLPIALTRLGRPTGSEGGLSAQLWEMRKGEICAFNYMALRRPLRLPLLPFLWVYSLLKHLRKRIRTSHR